MLHPGGGAQNYWYSVQYKHSTIMGTGIVQGVGGRVGGGGVGVEWVGVGVVWWGWWSGWWWGVKWWRGGGWCD